MRLKKLKDLVNKTERFSEPKGVNPWSFREFLEAPNAPACKAAKTPKTGRSKKTPCKPGGTP